MELGLGVLGRGVRKMWEGAVGVGWLDLGLLRSVGLLGGVLVWAGWV